MTNSATTVVLLFLLFAAIPPSTAEIKSVKIRSHDPGIIFFDYFKFTNTGHVTIAVSSVSTTFLPVSSNISQPDPSRFGFYLLSDEARYQFYHEPGCALDSKFISLLFTFKDFHNQSSFNKSYNVTYPNEYSLYFGNCNYFSHVTMDVRTELYNMDNNNNRTTKDYLSAGMRKLPSFYFIVSIIYFCFLGVWVFLCVINHAYVHRLHLLMGVLVVMKAMTVFSAMKVQQSVKVTGTRSHGYDVLFWVFQFITPSFLYIVIAVIFDGWGFLKPKAKVILMIVIPVIHVLGTVIFKVRGVTGIHNSGISGLGLMVVYTMICIGIITIVVFSLCQTDHQGTRKNVADPRLFLWFFIVVVVYLIVNLFMVENNNIFYSYNWKANAVEEIISLVFYVVMFLMFVPFEKHRYFVQVNAASVVPDEGV